MGRLFDAAAALAGVRLVQHYEGQAAMELEALVETPRVVPGGWSIVDGRLDLAPMMATVLTERLAGREAAEAFHGTLIAGLAEWIGAPARRRGLARVALGGGCLMNRVLAEGLVAALRLKGLEPALPREVPANDGGVSFGQAVFALCPRARRKALVGGLTMCLAIPVEVRELLPGDMAKVSLDGVIKIISTALVDDVKVGDYVVLHVGYALAKIDPEEAQKTLELLNAVGVVA